MKVFPQALRASLGILVIFTLLLGAVYPFAVMGFGAVFFEHRIAGSMVERGGKVLGSRLLAQNFTSAKYFWPRPSATTPPYNATASGASNFSPANARLFELANERIAALQQADPGNKAPIPVDLVTASASGLDPHISVAAAEYQIGRVARVRGMSVANVRALVEKNTEDRTFGVFGEPRVNVLMLNVTLDEGQGLLAPRQTPADKPK